MKDGGWGKWEGEEAGEGKWVQRPWERVGEGWKGKLKRLGRGKGFRIGGWVKWEGEEAGEGEWVQSPRARVGEGWKGKKLNTFERRKV